MAFDFAMFHERAPKIERLRYKQDDGNRTAGTEYLPNIWRKWYVTARKRIMPDGYQTQRINLDPFAICQHIFALRHSPLVLLKGEWDYALKLFSG